MRLQILILGVVIIISPIVPPILVPLSYSLTAFLLVQQADPRILSIVTVGVSTLGVVIIWKLQSHIIQKLTIYEKIRGKYLFSKVIKKINKFFRNEKRIARISLKREKYIETRTGRFATFMFAIFCYLPILPDIIGTRILYKKIKLSSLIVAAIIGKSITHIPLIFTGKGILHLLHIIS